MWNAKSSPVLWTAAAVFMILTTPATGHYLQEDDPLLVQRLEVETADRIRSHILDPILGPERSFAFVELSFEVKREREVKEKSGLGVARRNAQKCDGSGKGASSDACRDEDLFKGFGIGIYDDPGCRVTRTGPRDPIKTSTDTGRSSGGNDRYPVTSGSQRLQESRQGMGLEEVRSGARLIFKNFKVLVVHDAAVSAARLRMVREIIHKAYERDLSREAIRFHGADFFSTK